MPRLRPLAAACCLLFLSGCKAGPSAFERGEGSASGSAPVEIDADTSATAPDTGPADTTSTAPDAVPADTLGGSGPPDPLQVEAPDTLQVEAPSPGVAGLGGGIAPGAAPDGTGPAEAPAVDETGATESSADSIPAPSQRFPRPEAVRGIYLNAWAAGSAGRSAALMELAARTELNTFVIDIKDASGYVSHPTQVPLAHEVGATEEVRIRDLPGLLERLEQAGIYPIARIVIVKDPLVVAARPDLAVQDTAGGVWVDEKGLVWLNPHSREVWEYHLALAKEVVAMGFPEIQWDYVRFPDASRADLDRSHFPGGEDITKPDAIRAFLEYSREELHALGVQVTADVFGVTTSASRDVGIGQVWESFIDVVDVALPMVYPSHYWQGSFGIDTPNAYPYEIVREALTDAVRRSAAVEGAGRTRPWLQDFSLGQPPYGAPEVRAQIQATNDVGIDEWILWNPSSRYTEEALEPVGGFPEPPLIRVAGQIVPVDERFQWVDPPPTADSLAAPPDTGTVSPPDTGAVALTDRLRVRRRGAPDARQRR